MSNSDKVNREQMHRHNELLILNELRHQDLSRSDLAMLTGLSNSTIGIMIHDLTAQNLIEEKGMAQSGGGRRPVILSLKGDSGFTLLFKLKPQELIVAIIDLKMKIVYEHRYQCCLDSGIAVETALKLTIKKVAAANSEAMQRIMGIGISVPGLVDHKTGRIIYSSQLNLRNYDICAVVRNEVAYDTFVFKDTDAMILGERILGEIKENDSCLYFMVDSGVGASYLNRGSLLQLDRSGLEIGHTVIEVDGFPCHCGKKGCLEAYVGEWAAACALCGSAANKDKIKYQDFVERAVSGDLAFQNELSRQCRYLGRAVAIMVNLFSPNHILIGGPIALSGEHYFSLIERTMRENVMDIFGDVSLRFTQTGDRSSFVGMAGFVLNRTFFH